MQANNKTVTFITNKLLTVTALLSKKAVKQPHLALLLLPTSLSLWAGWGLTDELCNMFLSKVQLLDCQWKLFFYPAGSGYILAGGVSLSRYLFSPSFYWGFGCVLLLLYNYYYYHLNRRRQVRHWQRRLLQLWVSANCGKIKREKLIYEVSAVSLHKLPTNSLFLSIARVYTFVLKCSSGQFWLLSFAICRFFWACKITFVLGMPTSAVSFTQCLLWLTTLLLLEGKCFHSISGHFEIQKKVSIFLRIFTQFPLIICWLHQVWPRIQF